MNALFEAAKNLRDQCAETNGDFIHRDQLQALFAGLRAVEGRNLYLEARTESEAAKVLKCSAASLQRRRLSGELKDGFHYSQLVGRVLYAPIHIARIIEGIQPERTTPNGLTSKNSTRTLRAISNRISASGD